MSFEKNKKACPTTSFRRGFTLLEILLVVGIIAILAGIVIIAINPSKQLAMTRNTERKSSLAEINKAMVQYYIDHNTYPATLPTVLTEICDTGTLPGPQTDVTCGTLIDLSLLVPTYVVAIPTDPQGSIASLLPIVYAATGTGTGYEVMMDSSNKISLNAPKAELNNVIALGVVAPTHSVTYNGNGNTGGVVPIDSSTYQNGISATVLGPGSLIKTGSSFSDWNTSANGSGTSYASSSTLTMGLTGVTLYAQWTANQIYTVTFDSQSADTPASPSTKNVTLPDTTVITLPSDPIKSGNIFGGWYTLPAGAGSVFTSTTTVNASVTVYAKWTASYPLYPIWDSTVMTAGTTGSTTVTASDYYTGFDGWNAFNGSMRYGMRWQTADIAFPHWLKYDNGVGNSSVVRSLSIASTVGYPPNAFTLQGSQDNSTWDDLLVSNCTNTDGLWQIFNVNNTTAYRYYRLYITSGYSGNNVLLTQVELSSARVIPVPAMTANTTDSYVASADNEYSVNNQAWRAFDHLYATPYTWATLTAYPHWVKLDIGSPAVVRKFGITNLLSYGFNDLSFQGSNDDSNWTTILHTNLANVSYEQLFTVSNTTAYRYYRFYSTGGYSAGNTQLYEIRMWGNE